MSEGPKPHSIVPDGLVWPNHWEPVGDADTAARLENELKAELPEGHVLASARIFTALARLRRSDDVMFALDDPQYPVAIVHLTWKGSVEFHPSFPQTNRYHDLEAALSAPLEESD